MEIKIAKKKGYCYNSLFIRLCRSTYVTGQTVFAIMNRRDFLKRTVAVFAAIVLGLSNKLKTPNTRFVANKKINSGHEKLVIGGNLFNAYTRGSYSVNRSIRKLRMSQACFLTGWQTANNPVLQQLL